MALNEHQLASILKGLSYSNTTHGCAVSANDAITLATELNLMIEEYTGENDISWVSLTVRTNAGALFSHPSMVVYAYFFLGRSAPEWFAERYPPAQKRPERPEGGRVPSPVRGHPVPMSYGTSPRIASPGGDT